MEIEEDYSGYDDYLDLDRQWSANANDQLHNTNETNEQFQGIFQNCICLTF